MGIKNFRKFLTSQIKNVYGYARFDEVKIKSVCIDINIFIYKYITAIRKSGKDIEYNGRITSHIIGLRNQINKFNSLGIDIIYVFDGSPPKEKNKTLKDREIVKKKAKKKYDKTKNIVSYQQSFFITNEVINDAKEYLTLMGIKYIDIDKEADIVCASLLKQKIVDCVLSTDYDILIFGGDCLITNMDYKKNNIEYLNISSILNGLDISYEQLVDMIVLSGCDYCEKGNNLTLLKSYKMIKEYKSLSKILKKEEFNQKTIEKFLQAKKIFKEKFYVDKKWIRQSKKNVENLKIFLNELNLHYKN